MKAETRNFRDGSLVVEVKSDDEQVIARLAVRLSIHGADFDTYKVEAATRLDKKPDGDVTMSVGETRAYVPREVVLL